MNKTNEYENREKFEKETLPKIRQYWSSINWDLMPKTWIHTLNEEDRNFVREHYEEYGGQLPDNDIIEEAKMEEGLIKKE